MPKDDRGLYYYPSLQDRSARMYVRENDGRIEFRLFNAQHPEVWEKHGWLSMEVIEQAAGLYREERDKSRNPLGLYNEDIALRLIEDEKKSGSAS